MRYRCSTSRLARSLAVPSDDPLIPEMGWLGFQRVASAEARQSGLMWSPGGWEEWQENVNAFVLDELRGRVSDRDLAEGV